MNWSNVDQNILREIIITNYDNPHNKIDDPESLKNYLSFHNKSESCIDDIQVFILIENEIITDAKFAGVGCAISTASTNILCEYLKQKNLKQGYILLTNYKLMINHQKYDIDLLAELNAFKEIYLQQNRIKCSLIGVNAFEQLLQELNYEK